ncbi:hypothetical protein EDC01DRAFT_317887 [Geopyxis carbonaria]|nr:hypothetical protein EDC01DRAFT_317887 [Geopyxis carbonaria]
MSVMMAASAPGPVPVTQQSQFGQTSNVTMRGHSRQPSSTTRPMTQGGDTARGNPQSPGANINSPKRSSAAATAGQTSHTQQQQPRVSGSTAGPRVHAPATSQRPQTSYGAGQSSGAAGPSGTHRQSQQQPQPQVRPTTSRQPDPVPQPPQQAPRPSTSGAPPPVNPTSSTQQSQTGSRSSSFPHAFERWEMLSSRWEGLTGYWVSRLEGNRSELAHLSLEQEMSRQITDLAAAGANLFQALIELQRLRASSERKFQRWFFETRADQERAREMSSELERSLRVERQKRADAVTSIQQLEKDKANAEKMVQETQRELQISKDECRRAWEELGRREQEERETTNRLREGHPTLVGGVQVTPMPMPGFPSRSNSTAARPRTATGAHVPASQSESYSDQPRSPPRQAQPEPAAPPPAQPLHHEGDLIDLSARPVPPLPTAAPSPPQATTPTQQDFYNLPSASLHDVDAPSNPSPVSYVTNPNIGSPTISAISGDHFEVDEHGDVVVDKHGQPVFVNRHGDRDREGSEDEWDRYPDYEGVGYDPAAPAPPQGGGVSVGPPLSSGWEGVARHHHPTRLSDVLEEDERATNSDGRQSGMR